MVLAAKSFYRGWVLSTECRANYILQYLIDDYCCINILQSVYCQHDGKRARLRNFDLNSN